jgi:exopolyphosphatase/pppGpp-phosphohydrolase
MSKGSIPAARKIARPNLRARKLLKAGKGRTFYAVGGTWRNLARLHMNATGYPLHVMHHYEMASTGSAAFLKQVARGEIEKIKGIERVSKSRRALLAYGAIVLQEIIATMKPSKIVVSALGVREGFLYSLLSPERAARRSADLGRGGTGAAARPFGRPCARTVDWTANLRAFGIDETEDEARYRRAACLLADIGWRAHPEYRGTQSLNIIAHASFIGVDHPGRAFIALANLYRRTIRRERNATLSRLHATRVQRIGAGAGRRQDECAAGDSNVLPEHLVVKKTQRRILAALAEMAQEARDDGEQAKERGDDHRLPADKHQSAGQQLEDTDTPRGQCRQGQAELLEIASSTGNVGECLESSRYEKRGNQNTADEFQCILHRASPRG